jgi:chromosome segregation ATPase
MVKKTLMVVAGAALLLGLFFGRDGASYLTTSLGRVQTAVKDSVPVKFELDRARQMIKDLDPEIRGNMHEIAKEETEIERLARRVDKERESLAKDKGAIMKLKGDLESNTDSFFYAGRRYTEQQVRTDLAARFEKYKVNESTVGQLDQIMAARKSKLEAARQKLEEMLAAKERLEVEVENLEAQQKMVEVAQTASEFNFDDSQLSRTRQLLDDIRTRIEVAGKMVDADKAIHPEIPVNEPAEQEDITSSISKYFGEANGDTGYASSH